MPTRILIVGAGAIGAFYGSRLATAPHTLVSALCRSNYKAVKDHGFQLTSPVYGQSGFRPEQVFRHIGEAKRATSKFDYLLVATKAIPDVRDDSVILEGLVDPGTSIVLAQNGMGNEAPYRTRFPQARILTAAAYAHAVQESPGVIKHHAWTKMSVGPYLKSPDAQSLSATSEESVLQSCSHFVELLKAGGIEDAELHDATSIQQIRWSKVGINIAMNCTSVLCGGSDNRSMTLDENLADHLLAVMWELRRAAPTILESAVPPTLPTPEQFLRSIQRNTGYEGNRSSMLVDWDEGRPMELEVILGNPLRMAREKGVVMPRVESMYALLKVMQQNRDRKSVKNSKL
ncbi:hypothetical protein LTR78_003982 [Recurvomyces mirabilis]|uniref:2-dehydropantoate 2-reductase n=1 Tax=Recurvomyces mirabilis TaxID=574656 RepID=A0AAE0WQP1_9PEZI|nr:hypothetical protein LTR78_003982 [Recurvomyces mirabilis]KAK5153880.1 hypothetical protein LTS14_007100 [Recurvomyces mirabilis]